MSLVRRKENKSISVRNDLRKSFGSDNLQLLLLILPVAVFFFVFCYLPMFGVLIAFKDYNYALGILGSEWVGFDNFKLFFVSNDAFRIARNTLAYGAGFIILDLASALIVALFLYEVQQRTLIKTYQTIIILPHFMSWVVIGYVVYIFLNPAYGVVNNFLGIFGVQEIAWYNEPKYWPFILSVVNIWKKVGLNSIMYYAALMSIDKSLFEAATIDGAGRIKQIWHISIPEIIPIIVIMMILNVGNIFRGDFGLFYQVTRDVGALYPTTDVIDTYIYRGLRTGDMSVTTAVGLFQSIVGALAVVVTNLIVKKISPENSLF